MVSEVLSTTFSTIGERWKAILASTIIATIPLIIVVTMLLPIAVAALVAGMPAGAQPAATPAEFGAMSPQPGITVDENGVATLPDGGTLPAVDPNASVGASTLDAPQVEGPGLGSLFVLFAVVGTIAALSIAATSIGVFAAAGASIGDSLKYGMTTSPHVFVQCIKVGWPAIASYVVLAATIVLVSPLLGLLLVPVTFVFVLRASALATVAIGSIAHGHVSYSTELAREAVRGRMGAAVGANLVGGLLGGAASMVPLAGPVFMSAFISAMWTEFGDSVNPSPGGFGGSPYGGPDQTAAPAGGAATSPVSYSTPAASTPPAAIVMPAAATPAPTPAAAPALMAGPNWYLNASAEEPAGSWIQLGTPGRVALQVQWVTGEAPALHLADEAGTWRTPELQPTTSGESTWVDLPAGNTWVALVPREGTQQVWVATWIPDDSSAGATSHAA